jgi:hypothetical protein
MKPFAALGIVLATAALVAQPPKAEVLHGSIVAADTGLPVRNARVTTSGANGPRVVLSDAEGRFEITLSPGAQRIAVTKPGFAPESVPLTPAAEPVVRLARGAAVSGEVVDALGDPLPAARIVVETWAAGQARGRTIATAETDDRGHYRIGSLPAGTVTVAVVTAGATERFQLRAGEFAFGPSRHKTYYPGTETIDQAEPIRLAAGDEHTDLDLRIAADAASNQPFSVTHNRPGPMTGGPPPRPAGAAGTVTGRVSSTDGRALPNAQILLVIDGRPPDSHVAHADADGRYEFRDVPAGRFWVAASKVGYSPVDDPAAPNSPFPWDRSGHELKLMPDETLGNVDLTLARWGTLTGRVVDEYGDPVEGAQVELLTTRYTAGRRRLVGADVRPATSDDRGQFRIYAIPPGRVVPSATVGGVQSADVPGYARAYYPGTAEPAQAQFVTIERSQDVVGIDIALTRTRTATISGQILDAAGLSTIGGRVQLVPSVRGGSVTSVPVGARILSEGRFQFPNVSPGQYVVQASRTRYNRVREGEFGALAVTVAGTDVTGLVLRMSAGSDIQGRITFDSSDPEKRPSAGDLEISTMPVDFDRAPPDNFAVAGIDSGWRFVMRGINGPRRIVLTRVPAGWALREIRVNGIDETDRPLPFGSTSQSLTDVDVVLTDRPSELAGTVKDNRGRPAAGHVIAFPSDRDLWYPASRYLRTASATADGTFAIEGLPFGSYYVTAIPQLPDEGDDAWQDPAYLESLARGAEEVMVREGERSSIVLHTP